MKTTKWLLASVIVLSSTVMAQADPYDGARAAQRKAAAEAQSAAMSDPANCFKQVDQGPPPSAFSPKVAEMYKQEAEKQARFLNSEFCKTERRKVAEAQEKAAAAQRERELLAKQARKEQAEREAEQRARQAENERLLAIEMKKPENQLHRAYVHFARVQHCRQNRDGYLFVYISAPEYDRAQVATKAVETKVLAEKPDLNVNDVWRVALKVMPHANGVWERALNTIGIDSSGKPWYVNDFTCKKELQELYAMSPIGVYEYSRP